MSAVETKRMVSTHRYCHAGRQRTRGALTGPVQGEPGDVQEPRPTLTGMNTMHDAPADGGLPAGAPDPSRSTRREVVPLGRGRRCVRLPRRRRDHPGCGDQRRSRPHRSLHRTGGRAEHRAQRRRRQPDRPPARVRWALRRLRHLGGVDGTATFHNKTGFHTLSFERGTIASVSGSDVVIKAADGTTWTWHVVSDTVVRKNGAKTTTSALSAGETVFAGGPVVSGARDARLIIVRPSGPAGSGSVSPSGSQSAQSSLT